MENPKNSKFIDELSDSKFVTRKWNIVNINKMQIMMKLSMNLLNKMDEIVYNTEVLKSNLWDFIKA